MVKLADSQHRDCQFDSPICHIQNATGEECNGKPPHEFHFPIETQSLSLAAATLEIEYATQTFLMHFE